MPYDHKATAEIAQTPLDRIRAAERLVRERAENARAGRWFNVDNAVRADWTLVREVAVCEGSIPQGNRANAQHIALWHPAAALAVADMLHQAAVDLWAHGPLCECGTGCDACDDNLWEPHARAALALADVVLPPASTTAEEA